MKKFLRFLVIFIVLVLVILLGLALYEPQDVLVTRSVLIKAPKEAVFEQMVKFRNWTNWSPWYLMDTSMKMTYSGTDGTTGSAYQWKGQENKTGAGSMTNTGVEGTSMNFDVVFTAPRDGKAKGMLSAKDSLGMTKATWSFSMHMDFPFNAMEAFLNMDKMLGGDFETGLATMKKYVESHSATEAVIEVKEVDYPAHTYEGIRKTVAMADMLKFFADSYGTLGKELGPRIAGPAAGIYYTWDTTNKTSDLAAVFPVTDTTKPAPGAVILHAGPAKAYMAVLKGGYGNEMNYHNAIMKRLSEKGLKQNVVIEEYMAGPANQPDSNKWVTNIYYLVQ